MCELVCALTCACNAIYEQLLKLEEVAAAHKAESATLTQLGMSLLHVLLNVFY